MALLDDLKALIEALDTLHLPGGLANPGEGMPDFVTASNGYVRHFNSRANAHLGRFCKTFHANRDPDVIKVEPEQLFKLLRQVIANMHADGRFVDIEITKELVKEIKDSTEQALTKGANVYTHYFSAWTLLLEYKEPLKVGPATILTRTDWLELVDFPPSAKDRFGGARAANWQWKEILTGAFNKPSDSSAIEGLASMVYGAVKECRSLVKVTIDGYELAFSKKLASIVAKSALDCVSLAFGSKDAFLQQALHQERLPPTMSHSLVETGGFLWSPGSSLSSRISGLSGARLDEARAYIASFLKVAGSALSALTSPSTHPHPKLAQRWVTALDWFAEGNRESNDAIALTKIGTSLDVLSAGGKYSGILEMVSHVLKIGPDEQIISGEIPRTLSQLVKDIYDNGRSQILHGTHYDRLMSFEGAREKARRLTSAVLRECAMQLDGYEGEDLDDSFRRI